MSKDRWETLRNCADFQDVYNTAFEKYGVEGFEQILDMIEKELVDYENSSEKEWEQIVERNNVPNSVCWFVGMINTEEFCSYM